MYIYCEKGLKTVRKKHGAQTALGFLFSGRPTHRLTVAVATFSLHKNSGILPFWYCLGGSPLREFTFKVTPITFLESLQINTWITELSTHFSFCTQNVSFTCLDSAIHIFWKPVINWPQTLWPLNQTSYSWSFNSSQFNSKYFTFPAAWIFRGVKHQQFLMTSGGGEKPKIRL